MALADDNTEPSVNAVSPVPFYAQIKEVLRARILNGVYKPHQQMPSESEMIQAFNVSRITVRQVLNDLQKEGLIFKIHGKGTFVSKAKAFQELGHLQGFAEAMSRIGHEIYNRLLGLKTVAASAAVAERLQIEPRMPVTEIRRARYLNREPIAVRPAVSERA
jgi:GntR family transcriptional regulator